MVLIYGVSCRSFGFNLSNGGFGLVGQVNELVTKCCSGDFSKCSDAAVNSPATDGASLSVGVRLILRSETCVYCGTRSEELRCYAAAFLYLGGDALVRGCSGTVVTVDSYLLSGVTDV